MRTTRVLVILSLTTTPSRVFLSGICLLVVPSRGHGHPGFATPVPRRDLTLACSFAPRPSLAPARAPGLRHARAPSRSHARLLVRSASAAATRCRLRASADVELTLPQDRLRPGQIAPRSAHPRRALRDPHGQMEPQVEQFLGQFLDLLLELIALHLTPLDRLHARLRGPASGSRTWS